MDSSTKQILDRMFHPRALACFGGVATPGSFGQMIVLSQIRYGYSGKLFPISAKGGEINGRRVYKSLDEVEGPIDLAAISVPAKAVIPILKDCLKHGIAGAQIHSSGFAETGQDRGIALQKEIEAICKLGLRVVGPNCFGIHCPRGGITLLPGSDFSVQPGSLGLVSQSGGVATDFGYEARAAGLGISKIVSFGNGCDLDAIELLDYLANDSQTAMIGAYIEGVRNGRQFLSVLRRATTAKPVVVWKAGLSELGRRAAHSHTGSLAGKSHVWQAALAQAGAIAVQGLDELMDTLSGLFYLQNPGRRIALVGGGGAIGVFSCDLAQNYQLEVPRFSADTQVHLRRYFQTPGNSMANPLDTGTPIVPLDTLKAVIEKILRSEPIDVLILVLLLRPLEVEMHTFMDMMGLQLPERGSYLRDLLEILSEMKQKSGKDIVAVFDNRAERIEDVAVESVCRDMRSKYQDAGISVFPNAERALRAIHRVTGWRDHRRKSRSRTAPLKRL